MTEINVKISAGLAICKKTYALSSNKGYTVCFDFDSEWENEKDITARLVFDGNFVDIPVVNGRASLPKIPACRSLAVGVYSALHSTTLAQIGCIPTCADKNFCEVVTASEKAFRQIEKTLFDFGMADGRIEMLTLSLSQGEQRSFAPPDFF